MNRDRILWVLRILALAGVAIFGCSDSGGGQAEEPQVEDKAKESAGLTSDGRDLLVFNREDLDEILFKIDTVQITDSSFLGRLFFRNLPASKTPEPGDIIASSITKNAPYGFLYKVKEVVMEGENITIITVSYASLAEAVKDLDIEFEVPLVYDEESGTLRQALGKPWWKKVASAVKNTVVSIIEPVVKAVNVVIDLVVFVFTGDADLGGTDGKTISVDKNKNFGSGNGSGTLGLKGEFNLFFTTKIKIKNYSLDYAKMSVAQNAYFNLTGNLKGKIERFEDFELLSSDLPTIEFMAGPVPVILFNKAVFKAKVEVNAQANMDANITFTESCEFGFEYDNGFKMINTFDKDFRFDYKHSTYGSVRLGVLVGIKSMFYGAAGLEVSAGPSLVLKSPLLPLSANSETTLDSDLDVDVKVKLELLGLDKSWNPGSFRTSLGNLARSKTLPSFGFKGSDFDLKGISGGKLSFPFNIDKPNLGFSVVEFGFCIEDKEGECVKGFGFGSGKQGKVSGSTVSFEGLAPGTYNIIPYFKSSDGEFYYDIVNALKSFVVDNYCGVTAFDSKIQFCFGDVLYALCGSSVYSPQIQFCYDKVVYLKCGDKSYNPSVEFCFSGIELYALCGGNSYSPLAQFCFNDELYALCGGKIYDLSTQFCFSKELYDLCGGNNYNPSTQFCSNNKVYPKCNVTYDPSTHFCFDNKVYVLCGGNSYNPLTQFCFNKTSYPQCDGKSYDPAEGEMCCGAKVYNVKTQLCSAGDKITDKTGEFINDEQGYRYGVVKIGDQYWLDENLNVNAPRSRCYDDDPINCRIYGRLYDWASAMNLPESCNTTSCSSQIKTPHQGVCPDGWHIPTLVEWNKLILFADGKDVSEAAANDKSAY
ncbi:MAG: hypothetical protein FWC26_10675, partial [Fibromonadales bacterium]|nr:hypothetical protein [Fibromonadales bacterium]